MQRLVAASITLFVALTLVPVARADGPTMGRLIVPGDHFQPGEEISISGSKLTGTHVEIRLTRDSTTVDLGEADVAIDGTFDATATVPGAFPLGYAELTATDELGNVTSTIILIGDRAEGPGTQPGGGSPVDDRVVGLTLAAIGTVLFLIAAAWYVRGRPKGGVTGG